MKKLAITLVAFVSAWMLFTTSAFAGNPTQKEWTLLVFLNGHNNLDQFGGMNIRQMEEIGSTDQVNLVVQWASLKNKKTKRIYVQKSTNPSQVTSPVVQELPAVDMGDYKQLVEFVKWGAQNYPAKKYFVDVWNHGNGWQRLALDGTIQPRDISYDDLTGHKITTEQLGTAMKEIAALTGSKVEIYGSDACLMNMAEVGAQMADSVKYMVGSQEVEPGEGWPYSTFIQRWVKNPTADGAEVGKILTEEYTKAYSGGIYGNQDVTFSTVNLEKLDDVYNAVFNLSRELVQLSKADLNEVKELADATQAFYSSDYKDPWDFADRLLKAGKFNIRSETLEAVRSSLEAAVVKTDGNRAYENAHGLSIWLPTSSYEYSPHATRYSKLNFNTKTHWGDFLAQLVAN